MAQFTTNELSIHYEDTGQGYPVLLIAAGALNSTLDRWPNTTLNPLEAFDGEFRFITMDTRNAGQSKGPFPVVDPWLAYVEDQLQLLDYLGVDHFQMLGCCIGCSYALKMAQLVPDRLDAAVLQSPIGLTEANRERWDQGRREFVAKLVSERDDLNAEDGEAFGSAMWDDGDFVFSVTRDFVRSCRVPLLVLPGDSANHPHGTSMEIVDLAPNAECIDPWEKPPEILAKAIDQTHDFIKRNVTF